MKNYVLPQEHILKLTVNDAFHITMICTTSSPEMIIGYLYNEGLISAARDVLSVEVSGDGFRSIGAYSSALVGRESGYQGQRHGRPLLITEAESACTVP